jgi:pimeloyl-ACP methyl ester carboxylesterase
MTEGANELPSDEASELVDPPRTKDLAGRRAHVTRRRLLKLGIAGITGVAVAGVTGYELIEHGVLPGKLRLDALLGACNVAAPPLVFDPPGPTVSGSFFSHARRRVVGYSIAWPPGHRLGSVLPLVVFLHGEGGNHLHSTSGMTPAELVALRVDGSPLPPVAVVTADGGRGYWHPHPNDDPMRMVVSELIPLCQREGLGRPRQGIGVAGISMGGYGAIVMAEHHPRLFRAVAAIAPAIWTSYDQARSVNPGAYTDAPEFAAFDAVTHAVRLRGIPVRVASGDDDPFQPGVITLARSLPKGSIVVLSGGCHSGDFFTAQEPPSIQFLARHLVA